MLTLESKQAREEPSRFWHWAAIAAGAIAAIVMVSQLDAAGLNGDEGLTAQMVKLPWSTMLTDLTGVPSLLAVLGALPVLHRLMARAADRRLAAPAVMFAAVNPSC